MNTMTNPTNACTVPSASITTARTGASSKANVLGMRAMQERAYAKRGEQYLLIKSPPASGKSRALMFIALDKLHNQGLQQAIVVVPERSIGSSFADEPLSQHGFDWDWQVAPQWNLCNAPGVDDVKVAKSKVKAVGEFLAGTDRILVCTHATFRFAVEELGIEAFDQRLIAIDEFHHVSSNPGNVLGSQLGAFMARDKVHMVAMTGSYFRGDSEAVLSPADEARFKTVICKEDLNEVVTNFLQDKTVLERGLFDQENTLPEELTQLRMGKIVRERYPDLAENDQEAIRQHAIAAMNITQQAKLALAQADANGSSTSGGTALIDGVRKFVNVRDLGIDLIDRINPFDAAYAVLAKAMDEKSLRQVQASIAAKKVSIPEDEARELAKRALQFKHERSRLPDINSADAWEKHMAEGVAALARHRAQAKAAQAQRESCNG